MGLMAERVLPSSAEVRDYLANNPPVPIWMQDAIVERYAADGLVDRETIDYEAAANELHQHGPRYAEPYDGPAPPQTKNWRDCGGADAHEDASRRAVDAALGEV